jgi:coenzyme F420 hydrogenase subunit beta
MQALSHALEQDWAEKVELAIGLFCMGNWSYPCIRGFLEKHGIEMEKIHKIEISGPKVTISLSHKKLYLPLRDLGKYIKLACRFCLDFSSELADIAVGGQGSPRGWSTVIVRNKKWDGILEEAEAAGEIETMPLSEESFTRLEDTARKKIERNTRRILRKSKYISIPHFKTRDSSSIEGLIPLAAGKGFKELRSEIVSQGLCDACGACSAVCDIIEMENGLPRLKGKCPPYCSTCYLACTRTFLPVKTLEKRLDLGERSTPYLGKYCYIVAVRAVREDMISKGQNGAAVTALLRFFMRQGIVDGSILTCKGSALEPKVIFARNEKEILPCAGTVYSASTLLPVLRHLG